VITAADLPFLRDKDNEATGDGQLACSRAAYESPDLQAYNGLDEVSKLILTTAADLQKEGILVGRGSIMRRLGESGHTLSEYRVRKCLRLLQELNFLKGEEGIYGLTLTSKGQHIIMNRN
ncbi:MAG: hypothetical protein ACI4D7_10980, partial [Lachnospiraceae bacterium]